MTRSGRLLVALAVLATGASVSSAATGTARWQPRQAEAKLLAAVWADHRIVNGATCLGLDPISRGRDQLSSRFSCDLRIFLRPARIPLARWDEMAAAFRKNDTARIYELLGVPAGATRAEVEAAARTWGLVDSRPAASGLRVVSATAWRSIRPAIPTTAFAKAVAVRRQLLAALPAVEAYGFDNRSYAGMTLAKLRRIDPKVSARLTIVRATRAAYCVELAGSGITWSNAGPDGAPHFGRCPR